MKGNRIIALGLAGCMLISSSVYASELNRIQENTKIEKISLYDQVQETVNVVEAEPFFDTNNEYVEFHVKVPRIEGLKDKAYQEQLNASIKSSAAKEIKNIQEEAEKFALDCKEQGWEFRPYQLTIDYDVKSKDQVLSLVVTTYASTGGTGNPIVDCYNIDIEESKSIELKDLFKDDVDYKDLLNKGIKNQIAVQQKDEDKVYFEGDMGFQTISDAQSFYVEHGNLAIAFPKYSIAPGYMGTPEFKVSLKALGESLKDGYEFESLKVLDKKVETDNELFNTDITLPVIQGLTDAMYEEQVNHMIESYAMKDLEELEAEATELEKFYKEEGWEFNPLGLTISYDVKEEAGDILSFTVTTYIASGNGRSRVDYYNIDVNQNKAVLLDRLFVEGSDYITVINNEIKRQIKEQVEEGKSYFEGEEGFQTIKNSTSFYMQGDDLVVTFPKYSIAPGYMGSPEFKINKLLIKHMLQADYQ